ncbi:unnamed protein product [Amaranthus hypochondriacus]
MLGIPLVAWETMDPAILILDEATSVLEQKVNTISRFSTIQAADKIVVMSGGQMVEMGSHKELLIKVDYI